MKDTQLFHVAVVHSRRGVLLISVAESAAARDRDVAEYVRRQASRQLAPRSRDRVLALLDHGAVTAAVEAYFEAVGREWDEEWLHLEVVLRTPPVNGREPRSLRRGWLSSPVIPRLQPRVRP